MSRCYCNKIENSPSLKDEPVLDVNQANEMWEMQEGYDPEEEDHILSAEAALQGKQHSKGRILLVTEPQPHSWRSLYQVPSMRPPPHPSSDFRMRLDEKRFKDLFEVQLDESLFPKQTSNFDAEACRVKLESLRQSMNGALRRGDLRSMETYFARVVEIQDSIPEEFEVLRRYCRTNWVLMTEGYIYHGDYGKLRSFMDSYTEKYGLLDADRVLIGLRHFFENDLLNLAIDFWNDANLLKVFDERAYAESIKQFRHHNLFDESIKIVQVALEQHHASHLSFELTVHFYSESILLYVAIGDIKGLDLMLNSIEKRLPFGLCQQNFESWFKAVNDLSYPTSRPPGIDNLYEIQTHLFSRLKACMDRLTLGLNDAIRFEQIRHRLHRNVPISDLINDVIDFMPTPTITSFNIIVESLLIHGRYNEAKDLIAKPSSFPNLSGIKPDISTQSVINNWLKMSIDFESRSPEKVTNIDINRVENDTPPTFATIRLDTTPIHILFGLPSGSIQLLDAFFLNPIAPIKISKSNIGQALLLILELTHRGYGYAGHSRVWTLPTRRALNRLLDIIIRKDEDSLSVKNLKHNHLGYNICRLLRYLQLPTESERWARHCVGRLSIPSVIPIAGQLMLIYTTRKQFNQMDALWRDMIKKQKEGSLRGAYLAGVYSSCLIKIQPLRLGSMKRFIADLINGDAMLTIDILYNVLTMLWLSYKFDVWALWAVDHLRRQYHIPLTDQLCSMISLMLLKNGDKKIQASVLPRLHQDFDYYKRDIKDADAKFFPPEEMRSFEATFDSWFYVFFNEIPLDPAHSVRQLVLSKSANELMESLQNRRPSNMKQSLSPRAQALPNTIL